MVAIVISADSARFSILRVFRLFRVLMISRLLRKARSIRRLLHAAVGSGESLGNIVLFMGFIVFMYGLTGMMLYGNERNDPTPRRNFDNIGSSMLSLFVVLTNDAVGS